MVTSIMQQQCNREGRNQGESTSRLVPEAGVGVAAVAAASHHVMEPTQAEEVLVVAHIPEVVLLHQMLRLVLHSLQRGTLPSAPRQVVAT
jgi:hypothetical protein